MSQTVVERTADRISDSAHKAVRASGAIADAIDDGLGVVKRAARHGGDAVEEFMDDTAERLQRHLVLTVATTFAAGIVAGTLFGWTMRRR